MLLLKIGNTELKVKYSYAAVLKTKLLSRLSRKEEGKDGGIENIEEMLMFLPEFLLVGLQKFHSDEYGYNLETGDGKKEQIDKMFDLVDEYIDSNEDKDAVTLYNDLTNEMMSNGFLKSQFKKKELAEETKISMT